jgi:hypothetical protein
MEKAYFPFLFSKKAIFLNGLLSRKCLFSKISHFQTSAIQLENEKEA